MKEEIIEKLKEVQSTFIANGLSNATYLYHGELLLVSDLLEDIRNYILKKQHRIY